MSSRALLLAASLLALATTAAKAGDTSAIVFSPDGKTLVANRGDSLCMFDVVTAGKDIHKLAVEGGPSSVAFSPDGKTLAVTTLMSLVILDVKSEKIVGKLTDDLQKTDPGCHLRSVAFAPDGKTVVVGRGRASSVVIYEVAPAKPADPATPKVVRELKGHKAKGTVEKVAFSPDGKTIASASNDPNVRLWDAATGKNTVTIEGFEKSVTDVCFSPDGKSLAAVDEKGHIKICEVATGNKITSIFGGEWTRAIAFAPDGATLAFGGTDGGVHIWDLKQNKKVAEIAGDGNMVHVMAFSPDGKQIATGSFGGSVHLFDVEKKTEQTLLKNGE